jgi:magnesium transporter
MDAPKLLLSAIAKKHSIVSTVQKMSAQVKWVDFDLDALDVDYPQVTNLLFKRVQHGRQDLSQSESEVIKGFSLSALPWAAVEEIDWSRGSIRVRDLDALHTMGEEELAKKVLIVRDILDAYVIDLQNRRLRRANDLVLDDRQGLRLIAADTGLRAVLRRLSLGFYKSLRESELLDWKDVEFLRGDPIQVQTGAGYHRRIVRLQPGEIVSLAEGLPYRHAAELVLLLPHQLAADTFELMNSQRQLQVFEELDETYALSILEKMAPDIAADLIGQLVPDQGRHYLARLPKLYSDRIIDLLRYPANSVGGIMTNDMISIPGSLTVAKARERLRTKLQEPDFVYFIYVVDNDQDRHLKGVVTLRSILVAKDDQRLEDIMNPYLEALAPLDSPRQAAYRLIKSQLAALPVVAADNRLLGVVTVDAAVSLVAPESWRAQAPKIFS